MNSIVWATVGDVPVTQPWGDGAPGSHCGIDIGLIVGTPLFAARDGVVSAVGYGYLCVSVTGTNERDWYLHTDSAIVAGGASVQRGQRIAYSGAKRVPGGPPITGPHLHFEVQTGALDTPATSLNPVPVLTALYGAAGGELVDPRIDVDMASALIPHSADTSAYRGQLAWLFKGDAQLNRIEALLGVAAAAESAEAAQAVANLKAITDAIAAREASLKGDLGQAVLDLKTALGSISVTAAANLSAAQAQQLLEAHDAAQRIEAALAKSGAALAAA